MRGRLKALECEYVTFDGTNATDVEAIAGKDWLGNLHDPPSVLVRNIDGDTVDVRPGWSVARLDGTDGVVTSSAGAWAILAEAATWQPQA